MDDRAAALLDWYERHKRPLPWRSTRDPYALLVSEVMLQQTQAARVVPYYERWLERFPDAAALARAPVDHVLACWSGLGYNRRALALRRAAAIVAQDGWPDDLTMLPGVGPYTAAAVGSFAWGRQQAAIDTNYRRVAERWGGPPPAPPDGRAAEWNQAMMELGATICRARSAGCGACPVSAHCASAHAVPIAPRRRNGAQPRFEDTDRYVRGAVVRALLHGEPLPELAPERLERALAGLERDGLVTRAAATRARTALGSGAAATQARTARSSGAAATRARSALGNGTAELA